jgi:uncharacterized protein
VGLLITSSVLVKMFPAHLERYSYGIIGSLLALLMTAVFLRVEKKSFTEIGMAFQSGTIPRFITGFLIGLLISGSIIASLLLIGGLDLRYAPGFSLPEFLLWGLALLPLSFMEEVAFRGYPFVRMKGAWGVWATQFVLAILFALYHVAGGQSVLSSFLGAGVWGIVFGAAALISRGIAVPTGLHFAANLLLAAVGQKEGFKSIWTIETNGPVSATAQQRIDNIGNIAQIMLLVIGLAATLWYLKKKSRNKSLATQHLTS